MKIAFVGTAEISVPALRALVEEQDVRVGLVVTQPDRPVGRKQVLTPSPVKVVAAALGLPIFQPEKISAPDSMARLAELGLEAIVVFAYGQILKKNLLELPPLGCINVHASLLPRHRGAACIQAAILARDVATGVSIMKMDAGLDTGPVLRTRRTPVFDRDTAETLHDRLAALAPGLLVETLRDFGKGLIQPQVQDSTLATYAPKLTKDSGKIDWSLSAVELDCFIRAMKPWPSAFTFVNDEGNRKTLKIFDAIPALRADGTPGEILSVGENGIVIAAGKQGLLIREVQLEGRKKMSTQEFLRGFPLGMGNVLGKLSK